MPAARQRSRSPFMAWAVMAMIGVWAPVAASRARMAAVASKPSISGICTSISTTSNGSLVQGGQRLAAVAGHHDLMAPLLQQADRQPLVDRVVLGQQEPEPCRLAGAASGRPSGGGAVLDARRRAEGGHDRVQEGRLPDRLGQVGGDSQLPAARGVLAPVGRREHHQGGPDRLRVLPDPLGEREAVHLGHHGIEQHQGERRSRSHAPARARPAPRGRPRRRSASCPSW